MPVKIFKYVSLSLHYCLKQFVKNKEYMIILIKKEIKL